MVQLLLNTENEIWKPIACLDGAYEVSNFGRIKSLARVVLRGNGRSQKINEIIIKTSDNGRGYLGVKIQHKRKKICLKVHRVVAEAFIENPDSKIEVNHIDGNKKNNTSTNLQWVSRAENMKHAYCAGLNRIKHDKGESHYNSTLTEAQAREIKRRALAGCDRNILAAEFGVNPRVISNIKHGKRWAHVSC